MKEGCGPLGYGLSHDMEIALVNQIAYGVIILGSKKNDEPFLKLINHL